MERWSLGERCHSFLYKFFKRQFFYSEKNANQVIIGGLNKESRKLQDTAYFHSLKDKYRRFGKYENGIFTRGLIINDDSTRSIGTFTPEGAQGPGSYMKINQFYYEGSYLNGQLNGPNNLSINLAKKTVYYGDVAKGKFTGKAFFVSTGGLLYYGDYVEGKFTGNGWRISKDGTFLKGKWNDAKPEFVSSMIRDGKPVVLAPKIMGETIALLHDAYYKDSFEMLEGIEASADDMNNTEETFDYVSTGLLAMPGASKNYVATGRILGDYAYISLYLTGTDLKKATAKYDELCNAVLNSKVVLKPGEKPVTMEGSKVPADGNTVFSEFNLPGRAGFHVFVVIKKVSASDYRVYIAAGKADLIGDWLIGF